MKVARIESRGDDPDAILRHAESRDDVVAHQLRIGYEPAESPFRKLARMQASRGCRRRIRGERSAMNRFVDGVNAVVQAHDILVQRIAMAMDDRELAARRRSGHG